ncbi:MAG TPA: hydrogenase maturation protease [Sedimenticola sp.]|nr:hydrogenase maturation protease [Sedimenticola sp.]
MVLVGLGNPLMSDEGIGVRLAAEMESRRLAPPGVDVLDLGTAGLGVLHAIRGQQKAVFVDCALMGSEPGTMRRFTPEEVVSQKVRTGLSLHEGDLLQTLELARRLGECPGEIVIFGVEPASLAPGLELSPRLQSRLDQYLEILAEEFV